MKKRKTLNYSTKDFCEATEGTCICCPVFQRLGHPKESKWGYDCSEWIKYHQRMSRKMLKHMSDELKEQSAEDVRRPPTRKSILEQAMKCVCGDRDAQYSTLENSFKMIAALWETYLKEKCVSRNADVSINPEDVSVMMALFKIARISTGSFKEDSYIDACGYLACGGELEGRKSNED